MAKVTITYTLAATMINQIPQPTAVNTFPQLKSIISEEAFSGSSLSAVPAFRTLMIFFDEVSQIRGKVANGRITANATWDATRRALIPGRPRAIATTIEGIRPMSLVRSLRITGYTGEKWLKMESRKEEGESRAHRNRPLEEPL